MWTLLWSCHACCKWQSPLSVHDILLFVLSLLVLGFLCSLAVFCWILNMEEGMHEILIIFISLYVGNQRFWWRSGRRYGSYDGHTKDNGDKMRETCFYPESFRPVVWNVIAREQWLLSVVRCTRKWRLSIMQFYHFIFIHDMFVNIGRITFPSCRMSTCSWNVSTILYQLQKRRYNLSSQNM